MGRVLQDARLRDGFVEISSQLVDFLNYLREKDGWIEIPKDAKSNTEIKKQFMHNESLMREHL